MGCLFNKNALVRGFWGVRVWGKTARVNAEERALSVVEGATIFLRPPAVAVVK